MTRLGAFKRLRAQYLTERNFGWYDSTPEWQAQLRKLYPVKFVAAYHRREFTEEHFGAHYRRVKAFNMKMWRA